MPTRRPYADLTIGDMADRGRDGWMWAHCPLPCGRSVAVPIEYFVSRYGRDKPAELIFAALRCTSCGGHPTTFTVPSYAGSPTDPHRLAPITWDKVPAAIREAMGITYPSGQPTCPTDDPTSEAGKPQDGQYGFAS